MQAQIETDKKPYNRRRGGHLRLEADQQGNSPRIALAVNRSIYDRMVRRAEVEKKTISALTREALEMAYSKD